YPEIIRIKGPPPSSSQYHNAKTRKLKTQSNAAARNKLMAFLSVGNVRMKRTTPTMSATVPKPRGTNTRVRLVFCEKSHGVKKSMMSGTTNTACITKRSQFGPRITLGGSTK